MVKKGFVYYYSIILVFLFIVVGNCLTYNFADRLPLKLAEILAIPFIFVYLIKYNFKIPKFNGFEKTVIVWLLIGLFSAIMATVMFGYSISEFVYGISYIIRIMFLLVIAKLISYEFRQQGTDVFLMLEKFYVVLCIIGFYQFAVYPVAYDFYNIFYKIGVYFPNADPHIGRLISTYFDPNFLASCLVIPFSIAINTWKKENDNKQLLMAAIYLVTIILTNSRSGFLGLCVVIALVVLNNKYKREYLKSIIIGIVALSGIVIMFFTSSAIIERIMNVSSDKSAFARFSSWKLGFEMLGANPVCGIGYNMISAYRTNVLGQIFFDSSGYGNDSSLLLILISTGILGFSFFMYKTAKFLFENKKSHLKTIISHFLIASIVICNFNNLLFYTLWLFPVFMIFNYKYYYDIDVIKNKKLMDK